MVQPKKSAAALTNGSNKKDMPNTSFQKKDTMSGKDIKSQNGGFRTDSAISASRQGGERMLQRWQPEADDTFDSSLETSRNTGTWDQFSANEKLFGLKTDYDENMYTTQINKNHPQYRERMAAAERKAREIEQSVASTAHVAEERVMDFAGGDDRGGDEEDKYSGVKRQQQEFPPLPSGNRENKYTPPARRAPTGSATVKGAPVDPAIISSQLKTLKPQSTPKPEETKARTTPANDTKSPELKPEAKSDAAQKPTEAKAVSQTSTPLKPSAATSRTISPQGKEAAPSATSTVERDVLKEFKSFANQQRMNAEKARSTKAKADKEVKLIELKKFADSFKLPTPVPLDLIGIIAKDPAKQREIQEKAARDAAECQRRKAEEKATQDKKPPTIKETTQAPSAPQTTAAERPRPAATTSAAPQPAPAPVRHPGGRQNFVPPPYPFRNDRPGQHHAAPAGRQTQGLAARIRNNAENQKVGDGRQPPTGPANTDTSYARRMGMQNHLGNKLNPNSHEFRPSPFAASFSPNGHPSAGSSPRSALNNVSDTQSGPSTTSAAAAVVITKKKTSVDTKICVILAHVKAQPKPEGKNWADNDGLKPSFDTPPTWRQTQDDEKPESTMRLSYIEYFERQPFAPQATPNPAHVMPQLAHQHQLPFHLQHGAHNAPPRHSPHVPSVQIHPGQHGPVPHGPFTGADDHRMMHSNSSQSFSSPRMGPVPMAYPPNLGQPGQMPYAQNGMPFIPAAPQQMGGHFNRSFSNNPQYLPQQQVPMGTPMIMQPHFMTPQGMPGGQMQMYPGGPQFIPGASAPQPMPGANGYPSPSGRPAAPMMVHQGSQQGRNLYGMSPGMQPVFPQQPGQVNMGGYNPQQQFGTSPQQMHQYPQQPRNGNHNFKNYQGHNQPHQTPQAAHQVPTGPQGRTPETSEETK